MTDGLERLCRKLGYRFAEPALLRHAITHRSATKENNERLEFLGDSILNFLIADFLYSGFPRAQEGELSRLRATLVKGETLAELARELEIGDHLILGLGELKSGGYRRTSILADAFEAVIGAVYLDGGLEACRKLVSSLYRDRLETLTNEALLNLKDPKTRLQEYLQARQFPLPDYRVSAVSGEAHDQVFQVECTLNNTFPSVIGIGRSRRKAEQDAATRALALLLAENEDMNV
ncbi:ribonuclease III [Nitrosococcus oceani]|uniref:Ribonuclease 3 n=2 Tax=Nitrosococcus oceani TaxID=1229 RepID=RNC_NITOC|nr:ribonuclease III [Nitrosococcus oceani]Q3J8D5.1 RecName: Full=Ribonuclease 3; AltName: Full=Ribonuclease III; Short=RNase III [Nitrosococcus oceani ATCC 19707]KFI18711.1 ribonuclease III [Nitrosococcus oceani C-27]ABA58911.1 RNAse III [Nitrosococcus oceani ATCC 19707]EDZ67884.1 ribonuclease III [Nitrosococcus oceani AFC27]KFI21829.1 ribonuclease III [Nitrosococcus oceani]GEM18993.1 ribonuclease 3 [Nitrosococcus oceani]